MSFRDWQVGDRVVCVDSPINIPAAFYGTERLPKTGVEYTIREIGPFASPMYSEVLIRLQELVNPPLDYEGGFMEAAFSAFRFRKVEPSKTSIAILERFLLNPNAPVREDA